MKWPTVVWLSAFVATLVLGGAARGVFIWLHPFTYDEGAYLYDAQTLLAGRWPAGDFLTKAPVVAGSFMAGVWLTGSSLTAARGVNMIFSLLTTLPLAWLGYRWHKKPGAVSVSGLWLLSAGPIMLTSLGHTYAVALFLACAALVSWVWSRRRATAFFSGCLFAMAVAARKSSGLVVVPLIISWWPERSWSSVRWFLAGSSTVFFVWMGFIFSLYGWVGVGEVTGIGYLTIIFASVLDSEASGWGGGVTTTFPALVRVMISPVITMIVGSAGVVWLMNRQPLWPPNLVLLALGWFGALLAGYALWPTFLLDYVTDFLPATTLLAGVTLATLYEEKKYGLLLATVFLLISVTSLNLYSVHLASWTGSFSRPALNEAVRLLKERIPASQPVFTAAVIIPYLSGHQVLFDIAHPAWYRYAFIRPYQRNIFLPPLSSVQAAVRQGQVRAAIIDQTTRYMYDTPDQPVDSLLGPAWRNIATVANRSAGRSNTIRLWHYDE